MKNGVYSAFTTSLGMGYNNHQTPQASMRRRGERILIFYRGSWDKLSGAS